jgi:hypothetical protein
MKRMRATGWISVESDARPDLNKREEFFLKEPFKPYEGEGPPAEANMALGLTMNLGNYESARVDVGGNVPCSPDEMAAHHALLKTYLTDLIQSECREVRGQI